MPNLLHLKASRTQILNTLPNKSFGKEGDIVISNIKGRGVYLCTKAGGRWFAANRLSELNKIEKVPLNLTAKKLRIKEIKNSLEADKFVVSEGDGELKYRNSEQLLSDLNSDALSVDYKTSYCSLGQYTNKEECEANNGTWYYSENESHDSISNTAENQLLTIGSSIGKLDSEATLLYDGSTLEIKHNTDYDDNWQTSAQDALLKLSYDSDNYAIFDVDSTGDLTIETVGNGTTDSDIILQADGQIYLKPAVGGVKIQEVSAATADEADYGQLWVKSDAPNNLYFTDDTGQDVALTNNGSATGAGDVVVAEVTISEAEMNALHSTEKTLVAAQGGSNVIIPLKVIYFVDRDSSTTQSTTANMVVGVAGATTVTQGAWFFTKRFMWNESGDRILVSSPQAEVQQNISDGENRELTAKLDAAITSGSIDSCKVIVSYYVFDNS